MRTLRLLNLSYSKIDFNDFNNHKNLKTFLTVDNGVFHIFGPELMINGSDWKVNADIQFDKQAIVSFFDEELVKNLSTTKYFNNYVVNENTVDYGSNKMSFTTNNANYVLTYKII
jgi:hypothetical protein